MKGYLIEPNEQSIREVEINDWRDIAPALGCQLFDAVMLGNEGDTLFVDDEGLYSGAIQKYGMIRVDGIEQPLAGRGLVLGSNEDGESTDVFMSIEDLRRGISMLSVLR